MAHQRPGWALRRLLREVVFGPSSPVIADDLAATVPLVSQVDALREAIREKYLAVPPFFKIPYFLLTHEEARDRWLTSDLPEARSILRGTRQGLVVGLGDEFRSFGLQRGMFASFPITHDGVDALAREFYIYAVKARDQDVLDEQGRPIECARILAGIAEDALEHVSSALLELYSRHPSRGRHAHSSS